MGQKSKKIFAKRFDDDFDRICKEMGLTPKDSVDIEQANKILVSLGFIKMELRQKQSLDSKLIDELLALVQAPNQEKISLQNLR